MCARLAFLVIVVGCQPPLGEFDQSGDTAPWCTWAVDVDGDGFAGTVTDEGVCDEQPEVTPVGDCDDAEAGTYPGADELCDEVDQDCDGLVDEAAVDMAIWYIDSDGDGFGAEDGKTSEACSQPSGYTSRAGDCNDRDARYNPNSDERCDEVDNDCDGEVDVDPVDGGVDGWRDRDGDGWGDPDEQAVVCEGTAGWADRPGDCDDSDGLVVPDVGYVDVDGDGYGLDGDEISSCDGLPSGYAYEAGDCDDSDPSIRPGADETCDEVDGDCDGVVDEDATDATAYYVDSDGDGYGDDEAYASACNPPSGSVAVGGDCDDGDASVHPDAAEQCNEMDDDCDGIDDEGATDATSWYLDGDGDGHGDPTINTPQCSQPAGWVADSSDCDDGDASISPSAPEICSGLDEDCDGGVDEGFDDVDADGVADCVDDCPVYADTGGVDGDGSAASPYGSISSALALRGGSCDEVVLLPGTYVEQLDYAGEAVAVRSRDGYESVVIEAPDASAATVLFVSGEGAGSVLEDVTVTGGTPGVDVEGASPTLARLEIRENVTGVYLVDAGAILKNLLVVDNTSTGVSASGSDASQVLQCVLHGNGTGFLAAATATEIPTTTVLNTVVTGNTYGVYVLGATVDWRYNDVYDNTTDFTGWSDPTGTDGNLAEDPLYLDATFQLDASSPLIDAGTDTSGYGVSEDLGGGVRPQGAAYDFGAWEQ